MIKNFLIHRVHPVRDKYWDPIDVNLFDKCVKSLSNKYDIIPIEDIVFSDELHSKNKYATISFDDGYKDNIEYAAPILEKYKCKASFYVATNCIDNNSLVWTHKIRYLFTHTKISNIDLNFAFLPENMKTSSVQDYAEYSAALIKFIKKIPHRQQEQVINFLYETFHDVELPKIMMSWDDLSELKNSGHYVGSHTENHYMLGEIENSDIVTKELKNSGEKIREKLGYFPLSISYPVNSYNKNTIDISKNVGYKMGIAVNRKIYNPKVDDIFEIPRIILYNEPLWKAKLRMNNTIEKVKSIIRKK